MMKTYGGYTRSREQFDVREFVAQYFLRGRDSKRDQNNRSLLTLATLQINAVVVGLIVVAAIATSPQYNYDPMQYQARSGLKPVIRLKPQESTVVTTDLNQVSSLEDVEIADPARDANETLVERSTDEPTKTQVVNPKRNDQQFTSSENAEDVTESSDSSLLVDSESEQMVDEPVRTPKQHYISKENRPLTPEQLAEQRYLDVVNMISEGRLADAEKRLRISTHLFPRHLKTIELLVALLVEQYRFGEAIAVLEQATTREASSPIFEKWLVKLYIDSGRPDKAIERVKSILAHDVDAENLNLLATLYQQIGNLDDAKNIYLTALAINGYDFKNWLGIALVYEKLGQYNDARRAYANAQNLSSNWEINSFITSRIRAIELGAKS